MTHNNVHSQYLGAAFAAELIENMKDFFPEHSDLSYEELLGQQECVYQSFQKNERNSGRNSYHGHNSDRSQFSRQEGESSQRRSAASQLALDEAFARSLELGDNLDEISLSEYLGQTEVGSRLTTASSSGTPVRTGSPDVRQDEINPEEMTYETGRPDVRQDEINPDEMTYEQLQTLGDSIGNESRGLSEEFISRLPHFKYKTGFLSKKKNKEKCVICLMKYKNGDYLTTLPCAHQYHSKCISQWLKHSKNCPVCNEEVRDS